MIVMSICSLSRSVSIDSFTAHSKLYLNLQITNSLCLKILYKNTPAICSKHSGGGPVPHKLQM